MDLCLPEEFEAPRLVDPRPLVDPLPRFGDCPRARLLPRGSSIVLVANHEEEEGRRAEEKFKGILDVGVERAPIVKNFVIVYCLQ